MEKEIISKENITLTKGQTTRIKTNIEHLRTYNEAIIKQNTFLETNKESPVDFYIKTSNGNNLGYITLEENGPETYQVEVNQYLGTLKTK